MTAAPAPRNVANPPAAQPANANPANNAANATTPRNRIRVAAGPPNQRDCSPLRGIEKSECERRDTVRDDLPAGMTTGQAERKR
jgi:hypothetical protein